MKNFFTIVLFAILLFAFSTAFGQWDIHTIDLDLYGATIVDVADIDGDGDLDVVATAYKSDIVVWYENDQLNWTKHLIDPFLDNAVGVYIADIDGDDTLDVVAAGYAADRVVWYKNDQLNWTRLTIDPFLDGAEVVDVDDIDGDGDPDVVATGVNANAVKWYENNLPAGWNPYTIDSNLGGALSCHIADIDGDDTLDVAATGYYGHDVVWYKNSGGTPIQWTEHPIDGNLLGAWEIRDADLDGDNKLDLVATGRLADDVVWYKNNGGTPITWTKDTIDANLDGACVVDIADIDLDFDFDVFATGFDADSVVWYENDGGTPIDWIRHTIDANLNGAAQIFAIDINDDTDPDAVVTGQNANKVVWYENPFIIIDGIELLPGISPTGYVLSQNYPNPFNPSTAIEFSIPKSGFVTLKIYNVLGEEVATLVSDRLSAGTYSFNWEASQHASGVYLYRLSIGSLTTKSGHYVAGEAGEYIETKKMVLMK
jgi:hypothetical protein